MGVSMFILFCLLVIANVVMFIFLYQKILDVDKTNDKLLDYYESIFMSIKKRSFKNGL